MLDQAKSTAGEDVMQFMMLVLPVACTILTPVLTKFGFTADQLGAMQFIASMKKFDKEESIKEKAQIMKAKFIPPSIAPMLQGMMMGGGGMPM